MAEGLAMEQLGRVLVSRGLLDDAALRAALEGKPGGAGLISRLLAAGRCCIDSYTGTLLEDSAAIEVPKWMVWGRHDGLVPCETWGAGALVGVDR